MDPNATLRRKVQANGHANGHSKHAEKSVDHDPPKQTFGQQTLFLENFTGMRLQARNYFHEQVLSGMNYLVQIQKGKADWRTTFYNAASIVGSHDFFLAFFPCIIFAFGYKQLGGNLLQRAALGIWLGNCFKDLLCLPRPGPPVEQLNNVGTHEFGLPSTHAVTAICLPFYLLFNLVPVELSLEFVGWFLVAFYYMYIIAYSRLYLGMHSPADIIAGSLIGIVIMAAGHVIDTVMEENGYIIPARGITVFLLYFLLLLVHPEPHGPCPCFEDSACFLGSAAGLIAGKWLCTDETQVVTMTIPLFFARWFISSGILFAGRMVYKPIIRKVCYTIWDVLHLPRQAMVSSRKDPNAKPFPSPKWNVDMLVKYLVYFIIVEHCLHFSPYIYTYLGWW